MPKMCRGFNFPLKYPGEIAGILAGFYRDIVQCIRRDNFSLEPRSCMCVCVCVCVFCVCVCVCVCFQISSLKPLGQLKPNFMWNIHGIGEESLFRWSRRGSMSFVVLHYCQPPGGGGFYHEFVPAVQGV